MATEEKDRSLRLAAARDASAALCELPFDVVELRRGDRQLATAWRLALRATLGEAMAADFVVTGLTSSAQYVLERRGA